MNAVTLEIIDGADLKRDADGWEHYAYTVELRRGSETMRVPWRQGIGITDDPTAVDVLQSLLMDAATVENARSFEDWAGDLGYDPDSRKAERIYRACEEQTANLRILLGDDYEQAVFPTVHVDHEQTARRLADAESWV